MALELNRPCEQPAWSQAVAGRPESSSEAGPPGNPVWLLVQSPGKWGSACPAQPRGKRGRAGGHGRANPRYSPREDRQGATQAGWSAGRGRKPRACAPEPRSSSGVPPATPGDPARVPLSRRGSPAGGSTPPGSALRGLGAAAAAHGRPAAGKGRAPARTRDAAKPTPAFSPSPLTRFRSRRLAAPPHSRPFSLPETISRCLRGLAVPACGRGGP